MLLEDKIEELLHEQQNIKETCSALFINQTEIQGLVNTKNYVLIDILYYLLDKHFIHKNINLSLYRCLQHLVDLVISFDIDSTSNYHSIVPIATLTISDSSIDFEEARIGENSIKAMTFSANNLSNNIYISSLSSKYTISVNAESGYTDKLLFLFDTNKSISETTLYIRYTPIEENTDTSSIVFTCTDFTTTDINLTGKGIKASIVPNKTIISFSDTTISSISGEQTIVITGSNLLSNVTVTVYTGFSISLTTGTGFVKTLTLIPVNGSITQTIYIRFEPTTVGSYLNYMTIECNDVDTISIPLSGKGIIATISIDKTSLTFGNIYINTTSVEQILLVSGTYLISNITITAPTGYKVSKTSGSGYVSNVSITPTNEVVTSTPIYCVFQPTDVIEYTGNISCTATTAITQIVSIDGIGIVVPVPEINKNTSLLAFGTQNLTIQSSPLNFIVSGNNLEDDIVIEAPSKFLISLSFSTGYTTTLNLTPTSGTVSNTTIYCVFTPTVETTLSENITINSTSCTELLISVTGTGVVATLASNHNSIDFPDTAIRDFSTQKSFILTGEYLFGSVLVTAPTNCYVSLTTGGPYTSQVTATIESDKSINKEIFIVILPVVVGEYSDTIVCTSSGVSNVEINVTLTCVRAVLEYTTEGSNYWTCPTSITSIDSIVIGGGGGGTGLNNSSGYTPGAAGGQCCLSTLTVVPGRTYIFYVATTTPPSLDYGIDGDDSYILDTYTSTYLVIAKGGAKATNTNGVGSYIGGIGDIVYKGGNGGNGSSTFGGGGGGGAGTTGDGNNANSSNGNPGAHKDIFGGEGGNTTDIVSEARNGLVCGGAGAGVFSTTTDSIYGGTGAQGIIEISYG
jgi:hypothetical protein